MESVPQKAALKANNSQRGAGRGVCRSYYKGHMEKSRMGEMGEGGGFAGVGSRDGEKMQTTVIE